MKASDVHQKITTEILTAFSMCSRKAFLLLCSNEPGTPHEMSRVLHFKKEAGRRSYIKTLQRQVSDIQPYSIEELNRGRTYLTHAAISIEDLEADCDVLRKVKAVSSLGSFSYEPLRFIGAQSIEKGDKLALMFAGHLLGQIQNRRPEKGMIVTTDKKIHTIKLNKCSVVIAPIIEQLREWVLSSAPMTPPIILNKHCPLCQFRLACMAKAEQDDNLSLLDGISTLKAMRKYEKKGIFSIRQLSFMFKPRRQRKDAKLLRPTAHKVELQALAIRTGEIYVREEPALVRQPVEIFLDIEGLPDQQEYYLIGLLICDGGTSSYFPFWANTREDEVLIWRQLLEKLKQYPDAPIYHYGNYESKAIKRLKKRYPADSHGVEEIKNRLVNITPFIYGKVYFPVRTNGLKEIGKFVGASWSAPDASGLQSLVWRHYWEETFGLEYKQLLVTYNEEDCRALKLLTDELSQISQRPDAIFGSAIDRQVERSPPKKGLSKTDNPLHHQLNSILNFSYSNYDKKKICFRQDGSVENSAKSMWSKKGYEGQRKVKPKATKIVQVPPGEYCPKHPCMPVKLSKHVSRRLIIDLAFTKNGVRKTITEYVGNQGYCPKCQRSYAPPGIRKYGSNTLYGAGFKAWYIYQRVALRLPYQSIEDVIEEQFGEKISVVSSSFIKDVAMNYVETEMSITKRLLEGPFIHADETTINIHGTTQYVWVFTNGKRVIFRLRKSRDATIVHDLLGNYHGVLVSDFYPGYDSVQCKQQKCWVHLIRDLNNDLWQSPLDAEFGQFVLEVKNLIVPILEAVQKYGLKQRNLNKFKIKVEKFYNKCIQERWYKSELAVKYQKRFDRYRDSLFTFLGQDGLPWHNNPAESAIRHLAKQRSISGSFRENMTHHYLLLLGIRQTCRFQGKSFLKFLLSEEKDIDHFTPSKRHTY